MSELKIKRGKVPIIKIVLISFIFYGLINSIDTFMIIIFNSEVQNPDIKFIGEKWATAHIGLRYYCHLWRSVLASQKKSAYEFKGNNAIIQSTYYKSEIYETYFSSHTLRFTDINIDKK